MAPIVKSTPYHTPLTFKCPSKMNNQIRHAYLLDINDDSETK